ncbi:hypothetical protein H1C71_006233 [Ictidomys tridecemlineatus]|nr:hypothetical protein H1C71_006233 [Ictidomys tridecemlineatus]
MSSRQVLPKLCQSPGSSSSLLWPLSPAVLAPRCPHQLPLLDGARGHHEADSDAMVWTDQGSGRGSPVSLGGGTVTRSWSHFQERSAEFLAVEFWALLEAGGPLHEEPRAPQPCPGEGHVCWTALLLPPGAVLLPP